MQRRSPWVFFLLFGRRDNKKVRGHCLENFNDWNDTVEVVVGAPLKQKEPGYFQVEITPWDRHSLVSYFSIATIEKLQEPYAWTATSAQWLLHNNNSTGHGKPSASTPWTVYLRSHQPLDHFIMANKQPGSRPSLVKYVNSSVRPHINKTFWRGDITLKY